MLDLNDFRYFVEVVDRGGFSSAGRALQRPTSTISHRIKHLESELSLTLLTRTSRNVSLTEPGTRFYEHAVEMLERALDAENAMRDLAAAPKGKVRFTVATAPARYAMEEILLSFLADHPDVTLEQHVCDTIMDIVVERLDFAIRDHSGPLPDSIMIQRPLATVPWSMFAAPAFLVRYGVPKEPEDLANCDTLYMRRGNADAVWTFRHRTDLKREAIVRLVPRVATSCVATLKAAAIAAMGLVALPAYTCRAEVRDGRLVPILSDWTAAESTISALMPARRGMTPAIRAFLDHIAARFGPAVHAA